VADCLLKELLLAATVAPSPLDEMSPEEMRSLLQTVRAMQAKLVDGSAAEFATPQLPRDEGNEQDGG
jgi:hypothetical protein